MKPSPTRVATVYALTADSEMVPWNQYDRQHEAILKNLQRQLKREGWKYKRVTQSASFEWSWSKGGKDLRDPNWRSVTLSGWAPKRNWGDGYLFMTVYSSKKGDYAKVVWENPLGMLEGDLETRGLRGYIPKKIVGAYLRYAQQAADVVLKTARDLDAQ